LSGGYEGKINLWQFQQTPLLQTFNLRENTKINQIRFNLFGTKFGALDSKGVLELWNFDVHQESSQSFQVPS